MVTSELPGRPAPLFSQTHYLYEVGILKVSVIVYPPMGRTNTAILYTVLYSSRGIVNHLSIYLV